MQENKPKHISKVLPEVLEKIRDRTNAYRKANRLPLLPKDLRRELGLPFDKL